MRTNILLIGVVIFVVSIIGYVTFVPDFTTKMMSSFLPAGTTSNSLQTTGLLRQMGFPPFEDVDKAMHFGSLGLAFAGVGAIVIGVVARKKVPKKIPVKKEIEPEGIMEEPIETIETPRDKPLKEIPRSIRILQERLARGEITPKEYEDLKRFLE